MKNILKIIVLALSVSLVFSCNKTEKAENYRPNTPKLKSEKMTPEVLWSFGRIGEVSLSPDAEQVLYTTTYYNIEENRSYRDIYLLPSAGGEPKALTDSPENENNPVNHLPIRFLYSNSIPRERA